MPPVKKFEPVLQYRFEIVNPVELVTHLCKSVTLPKVANNEFKFNYGGGYINAKGTTVWEDVDVEMYVDQDMEQKGLIVSWLNAHREINGTGGKENYKDNYSRDIYINILNTKNAAKIQWKLYNAYILNADFGTMDWSSSELNTIKLTLRYDWADVIPM